MHMLYRYALCISPQGGAVRYTVRVLGMLWGAADCGFAATCMMRAAYLHGHLMPFPARPAACVTAAAREQRLR